MIARAQIRRLGDERAQSLVLTLLVLFVLAIVLSTVIIFTSANQRNSSYQKAAQTATSLAEAGLNNAVSVLANPKNSCCLTLSALLPSDEAHASTATYSGSPNPVKWWGEYHESSMSWTLHGKATVPNPTGPSATPIVKAVTATVQVHPPKPTNFDVGVWNTIYSPYGPSSGCDTTIGQGVDLKVKLFVGGNLCMQNNSIAEAPVYVGGWLDMSQKQNTVGSSTSKISSAHVGSWCRVASNKVSDEVYPCRSEPVPNGTPNTNVWVQGAPTDLTGTAADFIDPQTGQLITAPKICWAQNSCTGDPAGGWYTVSSPGPLHPCTTASTVGPGTTTPPVFDNNTTWGPYETPAAPSGSVPGSFNLTPDGLSYTCITSGGELAWDAVKRVLTVSGTIFIDGNVYATSSNSAPITYTGLGSGGACTNDGDCQSVIYVTGTVLIKSVKICAVVNAAGTDCNWTTYPTDPNGWDPNKKLLIFAANSQNSQTGVGANQGIVVGPTGTSFQGGLYANYQINTGQGAATQGPLVSGTQTIVTGQQFQGFFPQIDILPMSAQGPPTGFWIDPPANFSYTG